MRRNGYTLIELLVTVGIMAALAAFLWPVIPHRDPGERSAKRSSCQSNLKQIGLGFLHYAQDYNERLPLISAGKQGWAEEVQPYLKSWQLFQCPAAEKRLDEKGQLSSDYFINARVSGLNESKIPFRGQTLLLGDGIDNGATTSHFSELPLDWKTDDHSPARRHLDGANYAFADGHVKWLKPDQISDQPPNSEVKSTFALR